STALSKLADEADAGPYRVRLPRGYLRDNMPPQADRETYRWQGPARPGDKPPVCEVSLSPAPPERDLRPLLEKEAEAIAGPPPPGWSCGPAERGEVNGLTFVRARWSIQEQPQKWAGSGVIYLGFDGDRLIRVSIRETTPHAGGPLEAAPLTLHK